MIKEVNTWNWHGHLAVENIADVTEALKTLLGNGQRRYTVVCASDASMTPDVRLHQKISPESMSRGVDPINYHRSEKFPDYGSIGINDTYGAYSIVVANTTWIHFEYDQKVTIRQVSGSGNNITWVFVLEE